MEEIEKYKVIVDGVEYTFSSFIAAHDFRVAMCDVLKIGYTPSSRVSKVLS